MSGDERPREQTCGFSGSCRDNSLVLHTSQHSHGRFEHHDCGENTTPQQKSKVCLSCVLILELIPCPLFD